MKRELLSLWKDSTLIQGTIALGIVGVMLYLYVTQGKIDDTLLSIVMLVLGFYFGNKTQQQTKGMLNEYKASLRQHSNRQRND